MSFLRTALGASPSPLRSLQRSAHRLGLASALSTLGLAANLDAAQWNNIDTTGTPFPPYYHIPNNWTGYTVPGPADAAVFVGAAAYNVFWNATTASDAPNVGGLLVMQGPVYFTNVDSTAQHKLTINGSGGSGSFSDFSIAAGILTNRGLHLHSLGGGQINNGLLVLDGAHAKGAKLTVDGAVGFDVSGSLLLQPGAIFDNTVGYIGRVSGSTGTATVAGSGSQWNNSGALRVGEEGTGTLNVMAGGVVSNTNCIIANDHFTTGTATVTGSGSQWNHSSSLTVGEHGTGTLNVEAGGVVSNAAGKIAARHSATGIATVTGSGSQWNNSGNLTVCDSGNGNHGTLNVGAGGVVSNRNGLIGLGASGTVTVTGIGSQWNNSGSLTVGNTGKATLNVEAGGVVRNTRGYIGVNWLLAGGFSFVTEGVATVTGSGSQWINSHSLFLGGNETEDGDPGTLNVSDSGKVNVGNDLYSGLGTSLTISDTGEAGILEVRNRSKITNQGWNWIGYSTGSSGAATVTGGGSQWNSAGGLVVGDSGSGKLIVEAGGVASDAVGVIAYKPGSTGSVTVTGSGSQWNHSFSLFLGGESRAVGGVGTLNVLGSGQVNVGDDFSPSPGTSLTISGADDRGYLWVGNGSMITNSGAGIIGYSSSKSGAATVTGSGSEWNNSGDIRVGLSGNATLTVQAGGVVGNASGSIGHLSGSAGTATVTGSGSQWNNSVNLSVGGNPTSSGGTGSLTVDDLARVNVTGTTRLWTNGSLVIDHGGILETGSLDLRLGSFQMLNGGVLMADAVLGNLQNTSGILAPGHSPGTMSISGNYQQGAAATLQIELGGTVPGSEHDRLNVAGTMTLGGLLEVKLVNGFVPAIGQSFDIFDAASITGNFSNVVLPSLPPGRFWRTDFLSTQGVLFVTVVPNSFAEFATAYALTEGADGDDDGDQFTNSLEFLLGSNPTNRHSIPYQSFTHTGSQSVYSFGLPEFPPSTARYTLESSPDLKTWSTIATKAGLDPWSGVIDSAPPMKARVIVTLEDAVSTPQRFYRLSGAVE